MSLEQLTKVDAINKYYSVNNIKRSVDYVRFSILNDYERNEVIEKETIYIQKVEDDLKIIMRN